MSGLWRAGEQVLVQQGQAFVLLDPDGTLAGRFEPRTSSDEDDLWCTDHRVEGDRLVERTIIQRYGGEDRLYEEKVAVAGLRAVDDAETRRFTEAALGADAAAQQAAQREREREADARVTAIDGALGELGLGPDAARAQRELAGRVRRWNDQRAASLLRTLVLLSRARPGPAVIAAFTRACLLACFLDDVPALPAGGVQSPNPALRAAVSAHADALEGDAEGQELADAPRNASAFRRAAEALRVAAKLLA
ncbi:MAG: hypothetical protein Q8L48_39405 [Archangium sp.]|nr:hypothetical protein [Archangium sp.]